MRYEPSVVVTHAARATWTGWLAQRFAYGLSAAPLEARHGDAAAPLRADPRVLATLGLVLSGRPRAAVGLLGWSAASLARQLEGVAVRGGSDAAARQLAARGTALAAPGLARSTFRTYGPLLVVAAIALPPVRRPVATLTVAATAVRWWRAGRPTPRGRVRRAEPRGRPRLRRGRAGGRGAGTAPRGAAPPAPQRRRRARRRSVELDDAADVLARGHVVVALLDLVERVLLGDELVDEQRALAVQLEQPRDLDPRGL